MREETQDEFNKEEALANLVERGELKLEVIDGKKFYTITEKGMRSAISDNIQLYEDEKS